MPLGPDIYRSSQLRAHPGHNPFPLEDDPSQLGEPSSARSGAGITVARSAVKSLGNDIRPKFTLSNPNPQHFVTTMESSYSTQPVIQELTQPESKKPPNSTLMNMIDTRYYNEEDGPAARDLDSDAQYHGVYPHRTERLGFGRRSETQAAYVRPISGNDSALTLDRTARQVGETLARDAEINARPLVVPDPVDVGVHFVTTNMDAYKYWKPDEYGNSGSNTATDSNPITVYSDLAAKNADRRGTKAAAKDALETIHPYGGGSVREALPSTYTPSSLEGLRIAPPQLSNTELMELKKQQRLSTSSSFQQNLSHARHLRTTYRTAYTHKIPPPDPVLTDPRVVEANAVLGGAIVHHNQVITDIDSSNYRVIKFNNKLYGSLGELLPYKYLNKSEVEKILNVFRIYLVQDYLDPVPVPALGISLFEGPHPLPLTKNPPSTNPHDYLFAPLINFIHSASIDTRSLTLEQFSKFVSENILRTPQHGLQGEIKYLFDYLYNNGSGSSGAGGQDRQVLLSDFIHLLLLKPKENIQNLIRLCFDKLDVDKNSFLDIHELSEFLNLNPLIPVADRKRRIREFFNLFNQSEKGFISLADFEAFYTTIFTFYSTLFSYHHPTPETAEPATSASVSSNGTSLRAKFTVEDEEAMEARMREHFEGYIKNSWKLNYKLLNRIKY